MGPIVQIHMVAELTGKRPVGLNRPLLFNPNLHFPPKKLNEVRDFPATPIPSIVLTKLLMLVFNERQAAREKESGRKMEPLRQTE
jgi:hypothetical protein